MDILKDNRGFTLIEIVVVMAILSIMSIIALPRISNFFNSQSKNSGVVMTYITAVADDAFIKRRTVYLAVQLDVPGDKLEELPEDQEKRNSLSAYILENGKMLLNNKKILSTREFPSSFVLDSVILNGERIISSGTVLLPFYSDGSSCAFTLKIRADDKFAYIKKNQMGRKLKFLNGESEI